MDMGFSVKRSGNFLPRDLSMKKDSPCLESFSSEQRFAKVLPHPFFLRVHILGYSIVNGIAHPLSPYFALLFMIYYYCFYERRDTENSIA